MIISTGQKIKYLTSILHLSVPDMCSMNVKKHTHFIYILGTYWIFLHIVHISDNRYDMCTRTPNNTDKCHIWVCVEFI
jgi:hypothetical protein